MDVFIQYYVPKYVLYIYKGVRMYKKITKSKLSPVGPLYDTSCDNKKKTRQLKTKKHCSKPIKIYC